MTYHSQEKGGALSETNDRTSTSNTRFAVFRTDASPAIGAGHAMRCLTLANVLADRGWRCVFACRNGTVETVPSLAPSNHAVIDLSCDPGEEAQYLADRFSRGCDLLIVDHYGRDAIFEGACRPWSEKIMVIDDLADRPHDCDILHDQTHSRTPDRYDRLVPDKTTVLTGSTYALLRPQFAAARYRALDRRRDKGPLRRIFVGFGATDSDNFTLTALKGIAGAKLDVKVDVVLGSTAPHLHDVQSATCTLPIGATVHVDHENIADLMVMADLAIGAAGSTAWERCCLGLPAVVLATASNQNLIAATLSTTGAAELLEAKGRPDEYAFAEAVRYLAKQSDRRFDMAFAAATNCDGLGTSRVADVVDPAFARDGQPVRLRPATMDDEVIMLQWQNASETRRFARNPVPPSAAEHHRWMKGRVANPDCMFNVILHGEQPAGVVRLDRVVNHGRSGDTFEVSIFVTPEWYRQGLASIALALTRAMVPEIRLIANVQPENTASHELFRKAGFSFENGWYIKDGSR